MSGIFADWAPRYYEHGLPVIPLRKWNSHARGAGKAPVINEWQTYGSAMPSSAMQELWVREYPDSNIGLPLGPCSGLCAIDIDTEDEALIDAIVDALPPSPWKRIGKKGMVLVYRWQGQRNFKLRDSNNKSIVEFLGLGNQVVVPGSIHPETGQEYTSGGVHLWEVLNRVQLMPEDVESRLRTALGHVLGERGLSLSTTTRSSGLEVVPSGQRDIMMTRHAGYLAREVQGTLGKNHTLQEVVDHMANWVREFTSRVTGDDMDPEKGVSKLLEFLLRDVEAGRTLPNGWDKDMGEVLAGHPVVARIRELNQVQRWTVSRCKAWLEEEVGLKSEDDDWVLEVLMRLAREVARDDNFSSVEESAVINHICDRYGKGLGLKKPDVRKMFKDAAREGGNAGEGGFEDAGDHETVARLLLEEFQRFGEMRYHQGVFWQWDGACFGQMPLADIKRRVAEEVKGNVLVRRAADYDAVTKVMSFLCANEVGEGLEAGVNFANGFLDTDGVLHDHDVKYGMTYVMPFNYVPERAGECHRWLEYLERVWGDDEDYQDKVHALQEAFAATMFGLAPRYQRAFLLYGRGKTGKSTALQVLRAMMPDTAAAALGPDQWGVRFQMTQLVGRTLNVCGELPEESSINGDRFKEVVEGAEQTTEYKGRDTFKFHPRAAHWFASNHLPRTKDSSSGFVRRWQVFEFLRPVTDEERVMNFHEVLVAEEREAIAAWAVQGLSRLLSRKDYTQPSSHVVRLEQMLRANNSVAAWLAGNTKVCRTGSSEHTADTRECFDQYVHYMREVSRGWSVTYERFLQMSDDLGIERKSYGEGQGVGFVKQMFVGVRVFAPGENLKAPAA